MTRAIASWPWGRWLIYSFVGAATAWFRYLTLGEGIPNDHFVYISGGWQMLQGEWPTRDWVDPGAPLMFAASALAQLLLGQTLVAEAVLVAVAFGLGAALTVAAVREATGSIGLGVLAALLEVAVFPRTYGYPKVLGYAFAFLCFFRYLTRPALGRLAWIAIAIVVGFLFRHDHGLFLAIGGGLTVLLARQPFGVRARMGRAAVLAGLVLTMTLPYLVYVQRSAGLREYLEAGIRFSRAEAARQWHVWPAVIGDEFPFFSAFVYELHVLPAVALGVCLILRRHERAREFVAVVVPVSVVAVLVNYNFIRDPLVTRLADAIVPAVVLLTWLVQRAWQARRARGLAWAAAAIALGVFSKSVLDTGNTFEVIERAELVEEWDHLQGLTRTLTRALRAHGAATQMPSRASGGLRPFYSYLERCSADDDRLLVGGYLVEVPFIARRRFAAGQGYFGGSFVGTEASEARMLAILERQRVPFAVIPVEEAGAFEAGFPRIADHVERHYGLMAETDPEGGGAVRIFVDGRLPPAGFDIETGWPCVHPAPGLRLRPGGAAVLPSGAPGVQRVLLGLADLHDVLQPGDRQQFEQALRGVHQRNHPSLAARR
jgi:hypothetical protein